jgi:ABC-type transport system substrate-binding protein
MKNLTKILALLIAVLMLCGTAFAEATDLPRNETLYFGGQQWGSVVGTNPLSSNNNNSMAVAANARGSRTIMFETLYMYNMLDGQLYPLLADGDYVWNDDMTEMTVQIKEAAKWSDGTPLTVNGNEIGGIPFKKNEPAEILVSLDYHDYLSLEVECFE